MDLEKQQEELQGEAQQVLENLNLISQLAKYGQPEMVGSFALGLMTWRDIDIEVITDNPSKDDTAEIVSNIIRGSQRRIDITVIDRRNDSPTSKTPRGVYLCLVYYGEDIPPEEQLGSNKKAWKIDIHFVQSENSQSILKTKEFREKLTEEKRKIILEIKNEVATHSGYRKTFFSIDIYTAVLDEGVDNLVGFKDYLKKMGRELEIQ